MALRNFDVFWLDLDVFLFQSPTAAVAKVTAAVANVELLISGAFAATLLYHFFRNDGSMGRTVYLPTCLVNFMVNVGKLIYQSHGSYGNCFVVGGWIMRDGEESNKCLMNTWLQMA